MKHFYTLVAGLFLATGLIAQTYPTVSIHDVQYVDPSDLANCQDISSMEGDTVVITGVVIYDGNLTEVSSGSVVGGYRPGIHLVDTNSNGVVMGDFNAIQIHGVYEDASGASVAASNLDNLVAGWTVSIMGYVGSYAGETQIYPLNNNSGSISLGDAIEVISPMGPAPQAAVVNVGDLNDNSRVNQLPTGEQWEGSFVEFQNVTVIAVNYFSSGSRVSMDVADQNGNVINVSDRFLAQKLPSWSTVNPASPQTQGSFVAPVPGAVYQSLKGIILHSENGCTGGTGRGYELNPFDPSHYDMAATPPNFASVERDPFIPNDSETPIVTATISDFDGTVTSATMYYSDDLSGSFTSVAMNLVSGTTDEYEATLPAYANGTRVYYYLEAEDDSNLVTTYPFTPAGATTPNTVAYTVRENGIVTVSDIQTPVDPDQSDASPYVGAEVTVQGIVTSSMRDYDLGYVYIQEEGAMEYAGIWLYGTSDLLTICRNQEVEITGTVEEYYNYTRMNVTAVSTTGDTAVIDPMFFDPSDDAIYTTGDIEKYEGMLMGYKNMTGGTIMIDTNMTNFADYGVVSAAGATRGSLITSGSQSSNNFSSLYFSLIADDYYETNNGEMEVPGIVATGTMELDSVVGLLSYSFGEFKLLPRNNDDLWGLQDAGSPVTVDPANYVSCISDTTGVNEINIAELTVYPNPTSGVITIEVGEDYANSNIELYDLQGRVILRRNINSSIETIELNTITSGVYMMNVVKNGTIAARAKVILE